jgi:multidrug resistance efflux pump
MTSIPGSALANVAGPPLLVKQRGSSRPLAAVLATFVAALAFSILGTITEYAKGEALIYLNGRRDITATVAGVAQEVFVQAGQPVREGQIVVQLNDAAESAELARTEREWEIRLANLLRDPASPAARADVAALRFKRDLQRAAVRERTVRASGSATIAEVWVRRGQYVRPGDRLVSYAPPEARPSLLLVLPGHALHNVRAGTPARYSVQGFAYTYQDVSITSTSHEIVGPSEVRRLVGPEQADALELSGPLMIAHAELASATFQVSGTEYRYQPGMRGQVLVPLREESILTALIPPLRSLRR